MDILINFAYDENYTASVGKAYLSERNERFQQKLYEFLLCRHEQFLAQGSCHSTAKVTPIHSLRSSPKSSPSKRSPSKPSMLGDATRFDYFKECFWHHNFNFDQLDVIGDADLLPKPKSVKNQTAQSMRRFLHAAAEDRHIVRQMKTFFEHSQKSEDGSEHDSDLDAGPKPLRQNSLRSNTMVQPIVPSSILDRGRKTIGKSSQAASQL